LWKEGWPSLEERAVVILAKRARLKANPTEALAPAIGNAKTAPAQPQRMLAAERMAHVPDSENAERATLVSTRPDQNFALTPNMQGDNRGKQGGAADYRTPRRTPDLESSRGRIKLLETLAHELAIIKQETRRHCTVDGLKQRFSDFILWTVIKDPQIQELVDGEAFMPKAYAENLTLAKYGLTSRETLKKDRAKLRKAEKESRPQRQ
jgi:hypothetical protein